MLRLLGLLVERWMVVMAVDTELLSVSVEFL
jgi:hypothetical protein